MRRSRRHQALDDDDESCSLMAPTEYRTHENSYRQWADFIKSVFNQSLGNTRC